AGGAGVRGGRAPAGGTGPRVLSAAAVPIGQGEQLVVAGGGLLRVAVGRRLVGEQQLGQRRPAALHVGGGGLDVHPVFAGTNARRGVGARPGVHDAHAADPDRVVALVVAQHRDVDARRLGRGPDRRAVGNGDLLSVDG